MVRPFGLISRAPRKSTSPCALTSTMRTSPCVCRFVASSAPASTRRSACSAQRSGLSSWLLRNNREPRMSASVRSTDRSCTVLSTSSTSLSLRRLRASSPGSQQLRNSMPATRACRMSGACSNRQRTNSSR